MASVDVVAMPSRWETYELVVFEALVAFNPSPRILAAVTRF
ncbi:MULTISPECIES: hypothetical protein [unclassified Sulfitobacter]|nr:MULTISPECIES: hypothetical protein [unclassified Sulfitobacter]